MDKLFGLIPSSMIGSGVRKVVGAGLIALATKFEIQDQSWIAPLAAGLAGAVVVTWDWFQSHPSNLEKRTVALAQVSEVVKTDGTVLR